MTLMKLPRQLKGAIFDLDGTLLDSLHVWHDVDVRFFAKRGIPLPEDYYHAISTLDLLQAAHYTKDRFFLPDPPQAMVKEWLDMIGEEYALRIGLKCGARECLAALKERDVSMGIATSCAPELFLPALKRNGIDGYFSAFAITGETRGKQFPDVYLLAARRLNLLPEECAVFEDIAAGVKSAKAGGFYTVAIASDAEREALSENADLVLNSFSELFETHEIRPNGL